MSTQAPAWSREEFETRLRGLGRLYHIHHPYHVRMHEGQLSREQIQGWVANRYYYQISIPRKDAAILANCPDRDTRRRWIQRIVDHDGNDAQEGGIEAWTRLGIACGLDRETIESQRLVLPGVRFAVDAYVNFARSASWQEAACSSLTELFAPTIHRQRLNHWPDRYPWIEPEGLQSFYELVDVRRRAGGAVFFSSHQLGDVERLADLVAVIVAGRLVASFTERELAARLADRGTMRVRLRAEVQGLPSRLRALSPAASWHGDELVLPGPASARPAMLDVIREAGGEIRGLTAEEGHLDQFYRELIGEQP